ncbi:MAG: type VII toxin-antitoxin system HepT family RNase toxin, partial [Candidatus Anammoxibacter sp.]
MHIEPDDVLLNKASIIERCIRRIKEEYTACPELTNLSHLDALILNIERSCQATVDMAMHITAVNHLGIPQTSSEAFQLLFKNNIIDKKLTVSL